jgi:hypothetical protein
VYQSFGDDALSYFTERLDPARTRTALIDALLRVKRNKAFQNSSFLGLAIDGTTAGRSSSQGCALCRPQRNAKKEVIGYSHQLATISVVGTGLSLPFDAESYAPGDSEYAAGQRLLVRAVSQVGHALCRLPGSRGCVLHRSLPARRRSSWPARRGTPEE